MAKKNDSLVETGEEIVKKKGKPRGGNNFLTDAALNVEPGDNSKLIMVNVELMNMPDIDLKKVDEVAHRLNEYFALYARNDMKPTVAGMAIALGMDRRTLWAITHNAPTGGAGYKTALPPEVADTIKKAYFLLENMWESYMNSGKINPVSGIFLGKNNFGYQDKTEYVVTPNTQRDSDYDPEDIRRRYLPDGATIDSDPVSDS